MLLHNIISRYLLSKENKINLGDFKNNLKNNEIIGLINFIISKIKKKTKNIKKKTNFNCNISSKKCLVYQFYFCNMVKW